ncbi:GNAT family N-acetyltransferase [Legionella micdadei]|uniref:GNAT family N-acetyltransferase n=1 Tax=Legionella micdadei TaxID=451 RepID=UPI0009EF79DE|nr:GNAT family N-acetyltransferase [Legionella micdadei]ARH00798.1 GNAT family acetyltransferase [Legionella micdadei]
MVITKELAFKIENCIKESHYRFTKQCAKGSILELGTGAAFFSGENSFFSQVIGWGFDTDQDKLISQIETIENFYHKLLHRRVDIELSPLAGNFIFSELSRRGYVISELNNISILDLTQPVRNTVPKHEEFRIQPISENHLHEWANCVALGFEYEEAREQFYLYAKTEGVTPFGAFMNNKLVAGGTIAIHQGVCDLGVTSTLPFYRGRGLQKALLDKRIEYAIHSGAGIASVTTEPGSISDLNIQKIGFQIAYTRIKLSFPLSAA